VLLQPLQSVLRGEIFEVLAVGMSVLFALQQPTLVLPLLWLVEPVELDGV
jgi:hypothetical protein